MLSSSHLITADLLLTTLTSVTFTVSKSKLGVSFECQKMAVGVFIVYRIKFKSFLFERHWLGTTQLLACGF